MLLSKKSIYNQLITKNNFLDIGAGPGKPLLALSPLFKSTLAIEPKQNYYDQLVKKGVNVIQSNFQDTLLKRKFDLVLCCHMLYHVPIKEWPCFLEKLIHSIAADGIAIIIIGANRGKHAELCSSVNPNYQNSGPLKLYLDEKGCKYQTTQSYGNYTTDNFDDMYTICRFSVLEDALNHDQYSAMSKEEKLKLDSLIADYVTTLKNPFYNAYMLQIDLDFIIIKK
ncbi:class I SAM-dependent methyltransferase [Piscirickettsia litoralis]|uniref:class I SAM-dependent methyltransferase n=1 Tax=Piscirickettsia litoralis TaxID=1891921 RepID=UPI0013010F65|nr:class I SAM-dependent methyltransferase [Piscirickettsia litoralis]